MLRLCESSEELDFLPNDPFAARITALFDTYGSGRDFVMFWVQHDNESDVPVAAVSKADGHVTLCCTENTDFEELKEFLRAVGYLSITANEVFAKKLGAKNYDSSFIAEYISKEEFVPSVRFSDDLNCRETFELLTKCGFDMGRFDSFTADILQRLNKGTAFAAQIKNDNKLESCAFALFIGRKSVLLGAVATDPMLRGKGHASQNVRFLANKFKSKNTFIFCRNDPLLSFYQKNGFENVGKWAVISGKEII